jgi:hypothetical protein
MQNRPLSAQIMICVMRTWIDINLPDEFLEISQKIPRVGNWQAGFKQSADLKTGEGCLTSTYTTD